MQNSLLVFSSLAETAFPHASQVAPDGPGGRQAEPVDGEAHARTSGRCSQFSGHGPADSSAPVTTQTVAHPHGSGVRFGHRSSLMPPPVRPAAVR